ncbi:TetR/AcrR family transcriptional regulator [Streptomyces sp. NPDC058476]|uniref:TetR/AcrR family transcriptional regulator n=1 Tax=Streptomyces sp. NPDC058476 TaxID=3346519 RepID=UPI0036617A8C
MDQIAEAAEISPSTFFRYFPTKEDVVVQDEYDPALARALRARPGPTRPPSRRTDRRRHPSVPEGPPGPDAGAGPGGAAAAHPDHLHRPRDFIAVFSTLVRHWVEGGGTEDLAELYQRYLPLLSRGLPF